MRIPLHHNVTPRPSYTARASALVEMWAAMAAMNPRGFRQFRSGKHHKGRGAAPKTRIERVSETLDAKLA